MKAFGTFKFFAAVVLLLALLSLVFPSDGITIGSTHFYFPSLHKVLVREKSQSMDELLVKVEERDLSSARDSIENCHHLLFESQTRIWLPDDDITYFDRFFEQAENARKNHKVIRILHYGDSQIEQDRISCQLRERMQLTFGGGGPGLLPLRQPIPSFSFTQNASGSLSCQSTYGDSTVHRANGNYGPMLRSWRVAGQATLQLRASSNKMASELAGRFSTIRVLFNNRPGPLSVTITNRQPSTNAQTSHSESISESGIHVISWQMDSITSHASLTFSGGADVYGIMVDNGYGVAVDNISMRGVSGHQFSMVNADQLAEAYSLMDVGIILMQFGGNSVPYLSTEKAVDHYCERMAKQIEFVRQACPHAAIIFIGPSDMSTKVGGQLATYPKLPYLVEQLRLMANAHGAAYWSIYDAMGGKNSMVTWVRHGYAGADYIHFTIKGAHIMGDYLSDMILKIYELYKIRQQLTPEQFTKLWKEL